MAVTERILQLSRAGRKGGKARAAALTKEERTAIAVKASKAAARARAKKRAKQ